VLIRAAGGSGDILHLIRTGRWACTAPDGGANKGLPGKTADYVPLTPRQKEHPASE
jgi:hypothetical protein